MKIRIGDAVSLTTPIDFKFHPDDRQTLVQTDGGNVVQDFGSVASGDKITLYHFDMYRISSEEDLESTGFYDYPFEDNVAAVEWSENIAEFLPKDTIYITINSISENDREIIIEDGGRFAAAWD